MLTATINEVRVSTDAKNMEIIVAFHDEEQGYDQVNVYQWDIAELSGNNDDRKKIREFVRDRTAEIAKSIAAGTKLKDHFNDGGLYGMVMYHAEDGLVKVGEPISTADAKSSVVLGLHEPVSNLE